MRTALLAAAIALLPIVAQSEVYDIDQRSYAAIAYSPSTGKIGYVFDKRSQSAAENLALKECGESDAVVYTWVKAGFCALAIGADKAIAGGGWSYGRGCSSAKANELALERCANNGSTGHVVLSMTSDGQWIWDKRDHITIVDKNGNVYDGYGKLISPGSGPTAAPRPNPTGSSSSSPASFPSSSVSSPSSSVLPASQDKPNENGIFRALQNAQGG